MLSEDIPTTIMDRRKTSDTDLDVMADRLSAWLASLWGVRAISIRNMRYSQGSGLSNETILFEALGVPGHKVELPLVLRLEPAPQFQLFMESRFAEQYQLLDVLGRTAMVTVPKVYGIETDAAVLGRAFMVMQGMPGRAPPGMPQQGNWFSAESDVRRQAMFTAAVAQLVRVSRTPVDALGFLLRPELGASGTEQELRWWIKAIDWSTGGKGIPAVIQPIVEWLLANCPDQPDALSWGDARMGNILFDGDRLSAVLDWEMCSLAGPEADLGHWLFSSELTEAMGFPREGGVGGRDRLLQLWSEVGGAPPRHLHWHEVLAGFRLCVMGFRHMHTENWHDQAAGTRMRNLFIQRTRNLLGLAPADLAEHE